MKRINVLCAMRDARVVEGLRRELDERCSFRVVGSGEAVIASVARFVPDILVIDAVLPYIDGIGVIDRLRGMLGERMPIVIGGSVLSFSDEAFLRRGVEHLLCLPWDQAALRGKLLELIHWMDTQVNWTRAQSGFERAGVLLTEMGMNDRLQGYTYLAWAAALAYEDEERLYAIGEQLYTPIAKQMNTTTQNVERLIRHAIESTVDAEGPDSIYAFFGNTIDPMRGKPTNAQMIAMLAQRLRVS